GLLLVDEVALLLELALLFADGGVGVLQLQEVPDEGGDRAGQQQAEERHRDDEADRTALRGRGRHLQDGRASTVRRGRGGCGGGGGGVGPSGRGRWRRGRALRGVRDLRCGRGVRGKR